MINFIAQQWYMITSAFSSHPWYALLMSLPFIFFFSLFIIGFIGSIFIIYEDINPPKEYRGQQNLGGAIIILMTIMVIIPTLLSVPSMSNIDLNPQYLPRVVSYATKNNLEDIEDNSNLAYWTLQGSIFKESEEAINFRKSLLDNIPENTVVLISNVNEHLQKYYISCLKTLPTLVYNKPNSVSAIEHDIHSSNKLCAIKASNLLLEDVKKDPNIIIKKQYNIFH